MKPHHFAFGILIGLIWGSNFIVAKLALEHIPPIFFIALRFSLLAVLLLPWIRFRRGVMGQILAIALIGGAVHFALIIVGIGLSGDIAPLAIAAQLNVPFATILSVMFLGEVLGFWRAFGVGAAFSGVMILGFDPAVFKFLDALMFVAAGAFAQAISFVLMRRIEGVGVFEMQGWMALVSALSLAALTLGIEDGQIAGLLRSGWTGTGAILYNAVAVSLIGHGGMYFLVQRYPVTRVVPLWLLAPVWGAIGGVLFLGDTLTIMMGLGGVLTLAGVWAITMGQASAATKAEASTETV
ncbi:MAG: DMT family transporter [Rhodospirillales bacterium]|nr:DMT family transporter [Rhodospirillales bacterium]